MVALNRSSPSKMSSAFCRQLSQPEPDPISMSTVEWHDYGSEAGVLELHEAMTKPGPALELQLFRGEGGRLVALWVTADGDDLGMAEVGIA